MINNIVIFSDGGSRGNPGPGAGAATVFFDEQKQCLAKSKYFGICTNNQAEYQALLEGLKIVESKLSTDELHETSLKIFLDSELMVRQINGEYKIKNEGLKPYYDQIQQILSQFGQVTVTHVLRANNKLADMMLNAVLDRWEGK